MEAFFAQHKASKLEEKVAAFLVEQERCWREVKQVFVEACLEQLPELASNDNVVLGLGIGAYRCGKANGNPVSIKELVLRFPRISKDIQSRLCDDDATGMTEKIGGGANPLQTITDTYCGITTNQRIG